MVSGAALSAELAPQLIASARAEGFALAGVVDIALAEAELRAHADRYRDWVSRGLHGGLEYLVRGTERRADPRLVMPDARSVLCVAIPYPRGPAGAGDASAGPRYARYLQGPDYHDEIATRLDRAMSAVNERRREAGSTRLKYKVCVDTSAVLERSWAALAGLGWIGKNTLLIHPKLGSYLFLGEALIDHETGVAPAPMPDLCGHCTRCLDGCPTRAIVEPHRLDSNRCISFFTLEKRGSLAAIPPDVRAGAGPWVAGCDVCQEVCPFNLKPARAEPMTTELLHDATALRDWAALLAESPEAYRARVKESALTRVKPPQFSRNLAISLANAVSKLDPASRADLLPAARARLEAEPDLGARAEWQNCVAILSGMS